MKCLIWILFFSTISAHADYLIDQDKLIIGKQLWVYYDKESCRQEFKIYPEYSNFDALKFSESIKVSVEYLDKTPFNWHAGSWYVLRINNSNQQKAYVIYSDLNASHGYTKHLYFTESQDVDLVLLKNACVSNISPALRDEMLLLEQIYLEKKQKSIDIEDEKKKLVINERKDADKKISIESENLINQSLADENAIRSEENRLLLIKNAPANLRNLSDDTFCNYYGNYLRGERLAGFVIQKI